MIADGHANAGLAGWKRRLLIRVAAAGIAVPAVVVLVVLGWPMDTGRYLQAPSSGEMVDRNGRLLYAFLNERDQWCFARDLEAFGSRLVHATLAAEDQRFYQHPGVDPIAVMRALWQNLRGRRVVSGGSTITMQVIKAAGNKDRSLLGKARQAVQAIRLEFRCAKQEILRTYLNTAPYGLNLVGAEAAARRYFGKPARELTVAEAALLAALPKAPTALMPLRNPERARARRDYVLRRMREEAYISEEELRQAAAEPIAAGWNAFPSMAPHLAMLLKSQVMQEGRLAVTLDADVQQNVQRFVRRSMIRFNGDISNVAVLVVDVPTADVLARVGSADFFGTPGGGQVDACRAARSPGSALKPFAYALAIERSVLYPCEMLLDDSLDLGAYSPENYDGCFNGLIPASDALRQSLNVPAVLVLDRVGVENLHTFLRGLGLSTLDRSSTEYGLGLTLGNCEVRLDELAAAYCMLASLGVYRPLNVLGEKGKRGKGEKETLNSADSFSPPHTPCLSRGTCLKVFEMLEQSLPEELEPNLIRAAGVTPRVCWKTGTSTGHHDAWAFVFNGQYLVAVWMGNNDGKSSNRLVGIRAALPLAGRIFRSLTPTTAPAWPEAQDDLRRVTVCAVSGLPASTWCTQKKEVSLPRTPFLNRVCDVHRPVRNTGSASREVSVRECWPGSTKGWDLARVSAPGAVAGSEATSGTMWPAVRSALERPREEILRIQDPADQGEYVLTGEAEGDRIRLRASRDADATLYWYIDDQYLGASAPQAPLTLDLERGTHILACMTAQGALDRVAFAVTEPNIRPRFAALR